MARRGRGEVGPSGGVAGQRVVAVALRCGGLRRAVPRERRAVEREVLGGVQPHHGPGGAAGARASGVARDTIAVTAKAIGTVQAAGWDSRAPAQPPRTPPNTVTRTAVIARAPPATRPAVAPTVESPRHQTPSTSSGQNVDAATAKARPTVSASADAAGGQRQRVGHDDRDDGSEPEPLHPDGIAAGDRAEAAAQQVLVDHAGDGDGQPRGGRQERGEGAAGQQRRQQLAEQAGAHGRRQHQHHRVGAHAVAAAAGR